MIQPFYSRDIVIASVLPVHEIEGGQNVISSYAPLTVKYVFRMVHSGYYLTFKEIEGRYDASNFEKAKAPAGKVQTGKK